LGSIWSASRGLSAAFCLQGGSFLCEFLFFSLLFSPLFSASTRLQLGAINCSSFEMGNNNWLTETKGAQLAAI